MENKVLATLIQNREAYETLRPVVKEEHLSDIGKIFYRKVVEYYDRDKDAASVDLDVIQEVLNNEYPKKLDVFKYAIKEYSKDVSCPNVIEAYKEHVKYDIALQMAAAFNNKDYEEGNALYQQFKDVDNLSVENLVENDVYVAPDINSILEATSPENLIQLYPKALNDRLDGGVIRGNHVHIFARPETGKSLIAINMSAGFLQQGLKTLYIGNEDPASRMIERMLCRLSGFTRANLRQQPTAAYKAALSKGYNNFIFAYLSPGTFWEITRLVDYYKPDVVVIDQIRNINTGSDGLVTSLERASMDARNLAIKYNILVVSVSQAGESASGKLVLTMSDIDNSKTGLPAQVDLLLGVGCNEDFEHRGQRMISMPKNKISNDHSFFPVGVEPAISKVRSID